MLIDATKNLKEQLELARSIAEARREGTGEVDSKDAERLAELVTELDAWIRNGGWLPRAWAPGLRRVAR